jgi:hypothetical protein
MSLYNRSLSLLFLVVAVAAYSAGAHADITVQEQTTFNVGIVKVQGSKTERIAGEGQRTESDLKCAGLFSLFCRSAQRSEIVRLDRDLVWTMEPKKKQYLETLFPTPEQRRVAAEHARAAFAKLESCPRKPAAAPAVDISTCKLSEPRLEITHSDEVASFAGHDAHRMNLRLTQHCTSAQPSQECEVAYSFTTWLTTDDIPGLEERASFQRRYAIELGLAQTSLVASDQLGQFLTPYAAAMKQLSDKSAGLKGYPLKTIFRIDFAGTPCGASIATVPGTLPGATSGAVADAGKAAGDAAKSSAGHAAGWTAADAIQRSTGSTAGGYVAGSAADAFAHKLLGGIFAKRESSQEPAGAADPRMQGKPALTTLAELTVQTTAISAEPIAAAQFEAPAGWTRRVAGPLTDSTLPSCE